MASRFTRINARVLTVILVVALPVLFLGAAVVIGIGQSRAMAAQASQLEQVAAHAAAAVDSYVFRRILDGALLARVPDIRRAAATGSASAYDETAAAELDAQWQRDPAATSARLPILSSPASRFLHDLVTHDSVYREVLVTDRFGRLVAASNITSDYFQADEAWWIRAFDSGRGRVAVGDVHRDESAKVYALEIAVPVLAPDDEAVAGVMKIVADSREMLSGVAGLELGATSEAMLVRPDGSIVFRRRPHGPDDRFFASDLLRERLETRAARKEPAGPFSYTAQTEDGGRRVVAIAPSQLAHSYPELPWMMAVSMDVQELAAPFSSLVWYLALVVFLVAAAVLAFALWFSLRLAAPPIDPAYDLHLVDHAPIPRLDDEEQPATR
jgi:hypothetical protein